MPAAIPVAAAVVGGAMSASASRGAARDQAASADRATEAQRQAMERQIELQEPWRQAGGLGLNALTYGLGLSPTGTFNASNGGMQEAPLETFEEVKARLAPQFDLTGQQVVPYYDNGVNSPGGVAGYTLQGETQQAELNAAARAEYAKLQAVHAKKQGTEASTALKNAQRDPNYGNLLRDFSMADFEKDPGYDFRSDEGLKALERSAAARGGLLSGRAMKDTMRFSQGLASQEYGAAFDRFNVNKTNKFNRLASIAGIGQTAANQTGAAVGQFGQSSANNLIGAGNALAAGRVGSANAVNQGFSSYQQNALMNKLLGGDSGGTVQSWFSNTPMGSSGFGTGLAYGNQDHGQYL